MCYSKGFFMGNWFTLGNFQGIFDYEITFLIDQDIYLQVSPERP